MRVLVCGGRKYADWKKLADVLDQYEATWGEELIILQGGAFGADGLARKWAARNGVRVETFNADWERYGKAAGPIRNARMLSEGNPYVVVAFPGGRGTADMVAKARAAGVQVLEVPL